MTEYAWFAALCDDDYEFLGVPDPALQSSWDHCRSIVLRAEQNGFDNVLLPSGYALGIDATAFASAIAVETSRIKLLLAVRLGELVVPQLARQIATVQHIAGGRLVINAISSDVPGETLSSEARYQRTTESIAVLRTLLQGKRADYDGQFITAHVDAPRIAVQHPHDTVVYFGGLSEAARQCAAESCDVFLMWPDTTERMSEVMREMNDRAATFGRTLRYGWRSHVIVRETEAEARAAASRLLS
ncbi:MAG: LLM class flavin-dependent oxidoreductase, partial [Ilumatobacteraceae bacterium]